MKEVVIFKVDNKQDLELSAKEMGITVSQLMRKITTEFLENRKSDKKNTYNSSHLFIGIDNLSEEELSKTINEINKNKKIKDRNINFDF
jgi:uncharacterized FlaG/YvyC family protein